MPAIDADYSASDVDGVQPQAPGKLTAKMASGKYYKSSIMPDIDIIDIRYDAVEMDLKFEIMSMLKPAIGPKKLPTLLLYDERGLQIFERITYLDEYYLTNAEIDVLTKWGTEIAQNIQSGSVVIELGSGNLRKVRILLEALEAAGKEVDYYALDLSLTELKRTLSAVPSFHNVKCHGLHGTYDDGLAWLKSNGIASRPRCIMSLGSSVGNFSRSEASQFLKQFADILCPCDTILVGLDACHDPAKVYHAYNDSEGVTHDFILNGLENANHILNEEVFDINDWKVIGEYIYDAEGGRHQAFYSPKKEVTCIGISIQEGERVQVEQSLKYSNNESQILWEQASLKEVRKWSATTESYNIHLLVKKEIPFLLDPSRYASFTVPTLKDWRDLWAVWDTVTRGMIPNDELLDKPIKLRNACIFYLGHIPTFLDIQLSKATNVSLCNPSYYPKIFERGIDPDVDNPEHCHAHSEIPEEWPPLQEILGYQTQVRGKVERMYDENTSYFPRNIGRSLWIGFEHEIMHLETLMYMLIQSDRTLPPPRTITPDFEKDAELAAKASVSNQWFTIPNQQITIGLDDPDDNSGPNSHFGWDNEKPPRVIQVPSFQAQARPITNEEYARYLESTGKTQLPASWAEHHADSRFETNGYHTTSSGYANGYVNGQATNHRDDHNLEDDEDQLSLPSAYVDSIVVRTVYGPVPLKLALHWPVFASYDELSGCATWMGGRIPTVEEARSIYDYVDRLKLEEAEQQLGKTVPAVNGHLLNDGVEETPPSRPSKEMKGSYELFTNLEHANVGFTHWHPVAVTGNGNRLAGQAEMGGVWEWTSSPLEKYDGFEPMSLYPGYTADFFDGKHNIVLGGSWATHPRIAGRKTFLNWYQRNYPYAWAGARLVRDL